MKLPRSIWFFGLAGLAMAGSIWVVAEAQTLGKRRLPGNPTANISNLPLTFTKSRLTITSLSFEPKDPEIQQGGIFTNFYGSGYASAVMTSEDYDLNWEKLEPKISIYPELGQEAFTLMDKAPMVGPDGSHNYWYEYRGRSAPHKGGRILLTYNRASRTVRAMLATVVEWRPELNANRFFGVDAGVFTLHIELWDQERKVIYYGDTLIRLCSSIGLNKADSTTENFGKMMNTLKHARR